MAGRPSKDSPLRLDPHTGRPLPEGIRWREDRQRYQIRVLVPDLYGNWAERARTFRTLGEAKKELAKAVAGKNPNGAMTLTQWHERHWSAIEASVRPGTARAYGVAWRRRAADTRAYETRSYHLPAGRIAMVEWDCSPSTKVDSLALISRLLDTARRARIIDYNPAREIKRPTQEAGAAPTSRALTMPQVTKMLELIPAGVYRRYAAALVFTGVRAGEATAIRVRDVDLQQGVLRVSRSFSPGLNGELIEQTPKSHKERQVPIVKALLPHVQEAMKDKEPDDLLFSGPHGGRLVAANFRRAVDWAVIRTAVKRPDMPRL